MSATVFSLSPGHGDDWAYRGFSSYHTFALSVGELISYSSCFTPCWGFKRKHFFFSFWRKNPVTESSCEIFWGIFNLSRCWNQAASWPCCDSLYSLHLGLFGHEGWYALFKVKPLLLVWSFLHLFSTIFAARVFDMVKPWLLMVTGRGSRLVWNGSLWLAVQ